MKKTIFLLLNAALIIALTGCTPGEPDLKRTDYLKLVHSTLGQTSEKADKTLTRKGFTETDLSFKENGLEALVADKTYKFQSKDSTVILTLGLVIKNDTVKQFALSTEMTGEEHAKEAQKLYSDWSGYAYNTIYSDLSIWSGTYMDHDDEEDKLYIDGGLSSTIKNMITLYYTTGEMDEETYRYILRAFDRKRGDFEADMTSTDFLRQDHANAIETYSRIIGTLDISALANSLRDMKANIGMLSGIKDLDMYDEYPHWTITFIYLGEQDLSKIFESLPITQGE